MFGSTLWAAPATPSRWFDEAAINRSRAYHEPLARAAVARTAMQATGLLLSLLVVRAVLDPGSGLGARQALFAGACVALALWSPRVLVDSWMEYRHEPRFGEGTTLPVDRFLVVSLVGTVGVAAFGAIVAALVIGAASATSWWPLIVVAGGAAGLAVSGPIAARLAHRGVPLDPHVESELATIAAAGGVGEVAWGRMVTTFEAGMNAVSLGGIGGARVLCSDALLDADPELRDFVVAHEIGHLRRGHHQRAFLISLVGLAAEVGALWLADRWLADRWLLHGVGLAEGGPVEGGSPAGGVVDPRHWPLAVGVVALSALPVGLFEAWRSRSHERRADLDAMATVGVPDLAAMRSLHEHDRSDLAPGRMARLVARHPSPAERLRQAERTATAGGGAVRR